MAKRPADRKTHRWRLRHFGFTHTPTEREADRVVDELGDQFDGELTVDRTGYPRKPPSGELRKPPCYIVRHSRGPVVDVDEGLAAVQAKFARRAV